MVIKEHPEKSTSSRTVQMKPSKENSFPVTHIRSPVQSLQKMAPDPPSFLSFQRSAWKPGKSFQNPQMLFRLLFLPGGGCSLAGPLMVLPHQWDGKLAFTSRRMALRHGCPSQNNRHLDTPLTMTFLTLTLPALTDSTTTASICSLTILIPWRSYKRQGHLGYRLSIAQGRSLTSLFPLEQDGQGHYLPFYTHGHDSFIHFF